MALGTPFVCTHLTARFKGQRHHVSAAQVRLEHYISYGMTATAEGVAPSWLGGTNDLRAHPKSWLSTIETTARHLQSNGDRDQPRPGAPRRQNGCRPAVTRSGIFWYEQASAARSAQCDASTLQRRHREKGHIAAQLLQEPEPVPPRPRHQKGATWPPCESTEMSCLRVSCMFDSRRNH
jgi:hypothetical protein